MATHWVQIRDLFPDTSGKCWWEPYSILGTNDVWGPGLILRYDEDGNNNAQLTTRVLATGFFTVPNNYVGSPKIYVIWTSTITSGNAVIDFEYRAVGGDDSESLDQAGTQESLTVTDAAPGAANRRLTPSVSLTAGNLAAQDTVEFNVGFDGTDGSDTLAGARLIVNLVFEYADA